MGWPSSHEHDQDKRDDAAFTDHQMAKDLKKLLAAPVVKSQKAKKQKAKKQKAGNGLSPFERLERTVRQQTIQIADLERKLEQARQELGAERMHTRQLKERENKSADLLQQSELRRVKAEHEAEVEKLKGQLQAKEQELSDFRRLQRLFGGNG